MSGPVPVWLDPAVQVRALAAVLARLGLAAEVVKDPAGAAPPCVAVSGLAAGGAAYGYVHAAQDQDGAWRWWLALPGESALEAGMPLCEVSSTADVVSRALARAARSGPLTAVPESQCGRPAVAAA